MLKHSIALIVFLLLNFVSNGILHAHGLIKSLPADGTWASYDVETTITDKNGFRTSSTGTLMVRSVGKVEIDGKACRWLEFEHSWQQEVTEQNPRKFHSSITKIAIDESAFSKVTDPTEGIVAGYCDKTSAGQKPENWKYTRLQKVERGRGSTTGYGALDYYIRAPFNHPTNIDNKMITVGDKTLDCSGLEHSETTHKLGANKNSVTTTAFRQWTNNETPFGVVRYHFERIQMDGTSFNQQLTLKSIGKNANAAIPNVK